MLVYLDMCCLKRPFDDQTQPRVRLECEAVLAMLALDTEMVRFLSSPALTLENRNNHNEARALRIEEWLEAQLTRPLDVTALEQRIVALISLGFKNLDAMHVATAEQSGADVLGTCDDRFLSAATRHRAALKVRVVRILDLAKELAR